MNSYFVSEICEYLIKSGKSFSYSGKENLSIHGFCSITNIKNGTITWAKNDEKLKAVHKNVLNELLIVIPYLDRELLKIGNYIICEDPKMVFFSILEHFYRKTKTSDISLDSIVKTSKIGSSVTIGSGCYIGEDVILGNNVTIGNNVSIECPTEIGENSIVHAGVVIGTDGFGYYKEEGAYKKVLHFGGVLIGKNVEIGANTCIDRGTIEDTRIGDNVKIDNLCHIAHNVWIENNCLITACSLLGGSSILKQDAYIAPGAIIKNQVVVGENSLVGMGAVVTKDVEIGKVVAGIPAKNLKNNDGN